jgi:hypothetical protein
MIAAELAGAGVVGLIGVGLLIAVAGFVQRRTLTSSDGTVLPADVQALADAADVSVAVYALARVGASEAGGQKKIAKAGVMWVCMNEAAHAGKTVIQVILGSASAFGPQGTGGRNFVSTSKDPGTLDLMTAQGVADGSIDDPTGGALNFDSPRSYTDKIVNGQVVKTREQRIQEFEDGRSSEGKELVTLEGVPESTFRFWRPA